MTKPEVIKLQESLNALGAGLKVDGIRGPKTIAAEKKYLGSMPVPVVVDKGDYFGARWIGANLDLLGRHETDPVLNARYVPEWRLEGLPGYTSLSGNARAWCSVRVNADFRKVGVKGTNSAGAYSWTKWGKKSPFWFGAVLDIKHKGGGRHVNNFLYWIDEKKKIAATLDGNLGNKFCVAKTDLSGKGDVLVAGPRWPTSEPDGNLVSMKDVLEKYPLLKVGAKAGSSTR